MSIKAKVARRASIIFGLLLLSGFALILCLRPPGARVTILRFPEPAPSKLRSAIEGCWLWLRFHVLGPGRSILLSASIMHLPKPFMVDDLSLWLPQPDYAGSNGLHVWIVKEAELQSVRLRLQQLPGTELISQPKVQTMSGLRGWMSVGEGIPVNGTNRHVGVEMSFLPRVRTGDIDLTSTLTSTEFEQWPISIRTNLAVRSRIRIPPGSGAIFLTDGLSPTNSKIMALTLSIHLK
jgi:hypothetical protein